MSNGFSAQSANSMAFIGGGQMASAMIAGLLKAGHDSSSILVIEPMASQREYLEHNLRVMTSPCADQRLSEVDVIVWAVKPQVLEQAAFENVVHLGSALHVSIAAGLSLETLSQWLHTKRVVRAMPNTAALVGSGVTGMVAGTGVTGADRHLASQILGATGYCFWVDSDERLDAVTAVSGSGPAYVFHFLEAFQAAAEAIGFTPETARDLVLKTASGAIEQAKLGEPFGLLRSRVTSKRGTTEAALAVLDANATPLALVNAVRAAYERAGVLSRELGGQASLR